MPFSLRWQALSPLMVALMLVWALWGLESLNRTRMTLRYTSVMSMRAALDRALLPVEDRHVRSLRQMRQALGDPHTSTALSNLEWVAAHYGSDIERRVVEATQVVASLHLPEPDARFFNDISRLQKQLTRMAAQGQQITSLLDVLRKARAAGDLREEARAQRLLERADHTMVMLLRISQSMVQSACAWQAGRATRAWVPLPAWLWIAVGLGIPIALVFSLRPLQRLHRLIHWMPGTSKAPPSCLLKSAEAWVWIKHLQHMQAERVDLKNRLEECFRDCEKAQQLCRRFEHELALLRFYNENLVNSLRSALVVTHTSGSILSINRSARTLLSLKDEDIQAGMQMQQHALYKALAAHHRDLPIALKGALEEKQVLRYEAIAYRSDSQDRVLDLTVAPYQDESGAARGLLWVADDVTDAMHTKHQLLIAERLAAVGRLSAQVAHEIRNPLSAIGLNAELLEEEFASGLDPAHRDEAFQLLRAMGSEIERLTDVTEAYLQLARLPRPQFRPVDIHQLLADLFVMLAEEMKAHGIEVSLELTTPAPWVSGDPGQLRQAFLNIVRNSREAMAQGGSLRVITSLQDTTCCIGILDTGSGIDPQLRHRICEPFYSTKTHGTGLGLSLTQQIILEHSGTLEIYPNTPRGTHVAIWIKRLYPITPR